MGGLRPQRTGRNLRVLRGNRRRNIGKRQVVIFQLLRIDPHAHSALRTEQVDVAYAVNALHLGDDVALGIIQHVRHALRIGREHDDHQEVGARLGDGHAVLLHDGRQERRDFRQLVLHIHLRQVFVGFRRKGQRHRAAPARIGGRRHVVKPLHTEHVAFDDRQHAVFHHLRGSSGIRRGQRNGRRGHLGILGDRQIGDAQPARNHNEDGNHPGKNRAVNKKSRHLAHPSLSYVSYCFLEEAWVDPADSLDGPE